MERIAWGGETEVDGRWVPSRRESWVCVKAREDYDAERRVAVALVDRNLRARFDGHTDWQEYVVIEAVDA